MTNAKYRKSKRDNVKKDEGSSRSLKLGFSISKDVPMPNDGGCQGKRPYHSLIEIEMCFL